MVVALFVAHILKNPRSVEGAENMNEDDEEAEDNKEEKEEDENYENKDKDESEQPEDEKIKEELKEFATVQNEIIAGLTKLEPLINKADSFIEKFEKYSK